MTILSCLCIAAQSLFASVSERTADICIYGATSSGITAACAAQREGKSVLLIEPSQRIGGLSAGGLGQTDIGKVAIIRGLSLDFYNRVGKKYGKDTPVFLFEPKVALSVFEDMLREAGLTVTKSYRLRGVKKKGTVIESILLENSLKPDGDRIRVKARVFIDCSYEGDLMAKSGVTYTYGRESSDTYGESLNGTQMRDKHQFPDGVDPYRVKGNPKSGLLFGIQKGEMSKKGEANKDVQAYNYRIALTDEPSNLIPITRPARYDSTRYELLLRWKEIEPWKTTSDCLYWGMMPNHKTDINNNGGFSTDMIGESWNYPEANYKQREKIRQLHTDYTLGLLYFMGHDPRVPENIRKEMLRWGYPKDEYTDNNHFTPQIYIREARRMVGRVVMTQQCCEGKVQFDDVAGWAAYNMDSHNCGRYVVNGMVKNEGDVQVGCPGPYEISYRAITPKKEEVTNLIVPVCLSASHIAYGSIRMEPVFMVLGETSAVAASKAIDQTNCCVQDVKINRKAELKVK